MVDKKALFRKDQVFFISQFNVPDSKIAIANGEFDWGAK